MAIRILRLPRAKSRVLAVATAAMAAFYAAVAIGFALNVARQPVGLIIAPLFALLAWGMWTLSRFARWVTVIWIWVMVIVMPLGVVTTPVAPEPPAYWGSMLAAVTPLVVLGLFFLHTFGKHKREFKWP
ncbi:MAG TPA: hypothetical protein VII36_05200 [Usitatibacter sp.]